MAPDLRTCPRPRKGSRRPYPPTSGFRCLGGLTPGPPGPVSGPFTSSALRPPAGPAPRAWALRPHPRPGSEALARAGGLLQACQPPWAPTLSPSQASGSGHRRAVGAWPLQAYCLRGHCPPPRRAGTWPAATPFQRPRRLPVGVPGGRTEPGATSEPGCRCGAAFEGARSCLGLCCGRSRVPNESKAWAAVGSWSYKWLFHHSLRPNAQSCLYKKR